MSYEPTVWVDGDHVTSAKLNKLEQGVNSMSYTPTVWNAGDVVTAEKLNKLEQGVVEGGGGGDLSTAEVTVTLASQCGLYVPCVISGEYNTANFIIRESGTYQIVLYKGEAFGMGIHRGGDAVDITVTGNAEAEDEEVYITGDCTLSVSTV